MRTAANDATDGAVDAQDKPSDYQHAMCEMCGIYGDGLEGVLKKRKVLAATGANADPAGPATDGPRARRIETTVAELDSGRIETRDAVLEYWMDATGDSGDIALSIDFTHAIAQGKMHSQTRLLMGTGEWELVSGTSGSDGVAESVFVRVDRN